MYQDEVFLSAARINELRESRLDLLDEHPFPVQCVTHAADCTADRSPRLSRVFGITRFTGYQPRDDGLGDVGCRHFSKFYVLGMIANMCRSCPKRAIDEQQLSGVHGWNSVA